ncbi:MAG: dihydroorotate dehydrogenase electron transfer subunit [Candidatus Omnitrophota bacterium]
MKRNTQTITAKIISNKQIAPDHFLMKLSAPLIAKVSQPGQFVTVKTQESGTNPLLRIPLGIHIRGADTISVLYKTVGEGTKLISTKKKGEKVSVLGPLGNGFELELFLKQKNNTAIIVAGGHGIAPLFFLAEEILKKKKKIEFFIGASTGNHILRAKELEKMGAKVYLATEDGTQGHKGYVTDILESYIRRLAAIHHSLFTIYACGPRPMLSALAKIAKKANIPARVSLDAYMACGVGACLGCAVRAKEGYRLVCKDGPVFNAEEIEWDGSNCKNR